MQFQIEFDREEDGRWIAEIAGLPGVMAYGATRDEALSAVEVIALRALADRLETQKGSVQTVDFACA